MPALGGWDEDAMRAVAESASLSMVREFLAKKRYKRTLDCLYDELPVKPPPTKSSEVARSIGLFDLLKANSQSNQPFQSLLECLAFHLIQKLNAGEHISGSQSGEQSVKHSTNELTGSLVLNQQAAPARNHIVSSEPSRQSNSQSNSQILNDRDRPSTPSRRDGYINQSSTESNHHSTNPRSGQSSVQSSASSTLISIEQPSNDQYKQPSPQNRAVLNAQAVTVSNSSVKLSPGSLSALSKMSIRSPDQIRNANSTLSVGGTSSNNQNYLATVKQSSAFSDELLMEEMDDLIEEEKETYRSHEPLNNTVAIVPRNASIPRPINHSSYPSATISLVEALSLRSISFGEQSISQPNNHRIFSQPWLRQGWFFNDRPDLSYGLVQNEGGPCGLIAALQAGVLKQLMFGGWRAQPNDQTLSQTINPTDQHRALIEAIAEMLWRAGNQKSAKVVRSANGTLINSSNQPVKRLNGLTYKPDGLTESLLISSFDSHQSLIAFLYQVLDLWVEPNGLGCILLFYSLILSRGVHSIKSDWDNPSCSMIGQHSYCTQELVNLALTGVACSNVFDGDKTLNEGADAIVLKGVSSSPDCGVLSLFEHFGYIEVGSRFKCPRYPIWVVCSESHYTVLFATNQTIARYNESGSQRFSLFYYDELINQDGQIELLVDCMRAGEAPRSKDLEPPLNDCIRTKFGRHARIEWIGSDPIL